MKVRLELRRWGGAVQGAVLAKRRELDERRSILVVLRSELGATGLGEAAPLPGYSPDTLDEAWQALERSSPEPLLEAARARGLAALAGALDAQQLAASARFALETAVLDAVAQEGAWHGLLGWSCDMVKPYGEAGQASDHVRRGQQMHRSGLGGLVGVEASRASALALHARGLGTIKLKASGVDPAGEASWLRELGRELGAVLRVDLNGALALERAPAALEAYAAAGVELVEEPCAGAALLELGAGPVPWCADEALLDTALGERLLAHPGCAGLVLKPSLLGGIGRCLGLAKRAIEAGKRAILSHCFEGPVGLAAVAELALAVGAMERAAGRAPLAMGVDQHAGLAAYPEVVLSQLPESSSEGPLSILDRERTGLGIDAEALLARLGS